LNFILIDELGYDGCRFVWFTLIVFGDDLDCSSIDAAGFVNFVGGHLDAVLGRLAETRGTAGEIAVVSNHDRACTVSAVSGTAAFTG
jgi:hypothetical protein